ncbi:MAG: hypothetical protein WCW30_05280 [Candidatus Gracilibacteria bacterium]
MKNLLSRFAFLAILIVGTFFLIGCEKETVITEDTEGDVMSIESEIIEAEAETEIETENALDGEEYDPAQESSNFDAAMESLDVSKCNDIQNETAKESCISNVAIEASKTSKDPTVCDPVTNETAKATCLGNLGKDL